MCVALSYRVGLLAAGRTVEYSRSRLPLGTLKGSPMEVGIWNIPRLYFQHKEALLQRVGPWNIPDPDFHWEPLRDSQWRLESGIFHCSTSNTKKVPCRGSARGIFQIQTSEVGIWNIPRLYFQHKEGSLQRVRPWNIPDPDFHWEPLRDSQGKLESGIFQGSTSNTKKVLCRGSDPGIFQIQTSIGNP